MRLLALALVAFLLLSSCSQPKLEFQINTLSTSRAAPTSLLTVTGVGFNPDADIHVRFFDEQGFSVSSPAVDASPTSLTVSVPPFINLKTGEFSSGVVGVQVVQKSNVATLTSNTIGGLQIEDLPSFSEPTGSITIAYLDNIIQLLQDSKKHLAILEKLSGGEVSSPELVTFLDELGVKYSAVKKEVESVIANPTKSVIFGKSKDDTLELDIKTIAVIDRLIGSVEQQVTSGLTKSTALRMKNGDSVFMPLKHEEPGFMLVSWKPKEPDVVLWQSKPEEGLSLEGLLLSDAIQRVKTWGGYAGFMVSLTDSVNRYYYQNPRLTKALPLPTMLGALHWGALTAVPATITLYQDLSAITAGTSKEAWEQAAPVVGRFMLKVGPGVIDMMTGVPLLTGIGLMADLMGLPGEPTGGILLNYSTTADLARAAAFDSGRLPTQSGLDLVRGDEDKEEHDTTPTPTPTPPTPEPEPTPTPTPPTPEPEPTPTPTPPTPEPEPEPTATPTPPTPEPAPVLTPGLSAARDLTGTWKGSGVYYYMDIATGQRVITVTVDITLEVVQRDNAVTADMWVRVVKQEPPGTVDVKDPYPGYSVFPATDENHSLQGTVSATTLTLRTTDTTGYTDLWEFTFTTDLMSGGFHTQTFGDELVEVKSDPKAFSLVRQRN